VSLSEQQIVDCDHSCSQVGDPPQVICDSGCQGGWPWAAMYGVMQSGGIMSETDYPYTVRFPAPRDSRHMICWSDVGPVQGEDGTCQYQSGKAAVHIANYTCLPTDEDQIAAYVAQSGPVSVALNAGHLQFYLGGVSDPLFCDSKHLDHAVRAAAGWRGWG
jgi:cathepsin F